MTIKQKLFGALAVLGITLITLVGGFTWSARSGEASLSTVLNDRVLPLKDLKLVADGYAVQVVDAAHKARNGNVTNAAALHTLIRGERELDGAWKRYRATKIVGDEEVLAKSAEAAMAKASSATDKLEAILRSEDQAALDQFVTTELYQTIDPVSEAIGKLVSLQIDVAEKETHTALETASAMLVLLVVLALIGVAVLATSIFIVARKVVSPIQNLAIAIRALASADGKAGVPHLEQQDEIGDIARAVDAFVASVVAKERDGATTAAAVQNIVTTSLSEGLSAMAQGDLTKEITVDFPDSYVALKNNFNLALAELRALIGSVAESAAAIRTGSGEIAQASEDLARRTEANAASLEETSAAVTQMDGRLKATSDAANRTVMRADGAISTVQGGRDVADEAMRAMTRVNESAKGIDSVIEGLDKIAFQTRVLAMNAAVEAGRAGEAGRGFAVVADLVSALAMRAEEEAGRARDQLTATQSDIVSAVEMVQKVDGALANISGDVAEVHALLGQIATDNQAQSTAISQISVAIGTMDQATQQNAAMVEQTSAAARNLSSEVSVLAEQSAKFEVGTATPKTFHPASSKRPGNTGYTSPSKSLPASISPQARDDWASF
ncbi:methyl-accepting chemotaxis protein [Sphingomonas xinjiangensis]|uniref:Methyl-accepting chemotaxis protein n=1 Tax=Sphingomonas xinjiangensis TaxID=643568 RepID=A0A840YSN8_9SPHN|nr:methyl-accepting chemotaxis protein [Sphingomonas xinjiangensis]MBB5712688.1 methyl-accepting chemotaxis protein [Sphingomonas xinjiangensis]